MRGVLRACRGSMCARRDHRHVQRGVLGDVQGVYKSRYFGFSVILGFRVWCRARATLNFMTGRWRSIETPGRSTFHGRFLKHGVRTPDFGAHQAQRCAKRLTGAELSCASAHITRKAWRRRKFSLSATSLSTIHDDVQLGECFSDVQGRGTDESAWRARIARGAYCAGRVLRRARAR